MDFRQLYSGEQLAQFEKVRAAMVADPTVLDNRGEAVASVAALNQEGNGNGNS